MEPIYSVQMIGAQGFHCVKDSRRIGVSRLLNFYRMLKTSGYSVCLIVSYSL